MKTPRTDGDAQLGLGLRVPSRPLRLSRDLARVPLERYRIPGKDGDGRKWKAVARERMALAEWLAIHGDADGSRIFPSEHSITRHFRWSRRKTFYLLTDLKELKLLESSGLTSERGTRVRRMNLTTFLEGAGVQDSVGAGVQDSRSSPGAGVQDSRAGVQSNVAHNRHLTDTRPVAGFEVESVTETGEAKSSSSGKDDDDSSLRPDWEPIERKIESLIEEARSALVRDGWPAHIVDAGLHWIEERSDFSGTVPASANYYIVSFNAAMADHRDKAKILERAKRRERVMGSQLELRRTADDLERKSQASGSPIKAILEERSRVPATSRSGSRR